MSYENEMSTDGESNGGGKCRAESIYRLASDQLEMQFLSREMLSG